MVLVDCDISNLEKSSVCMEGMLTLMCSNPGVQTINYPHVAGMFVPNLMFLVASE